MSEDIFIEVLLERKAVVSCCLSEVVFSGEGCLSSVFGERDVGPCVTRVRSVMFECCPASALRCVVSGPLGDTSGSFSLVMAYVNVSFAAVSNCL